MVVSASRYLQIAGFLLHRGADIEARGDIDATSLHLAFALEICSSIG